jgi:hypothetical protein
MDESEVRCRQRKCSICNGKYHMYKKCPSRSRGEVVPSGVVYITSNLTVAGLHCNPYHVHMYICKLVIPRAMLQDILLECDQYVLHRICCINMLHMNMYENGHIYNLTKKLLVS